MFEGIEGLEKVEVRQAPVAPVVEANDQAAIPPTETTPPPVTETPPPPPASTEPAPASNEYWREYGFDNADGIKTALKERTELATLREQLQGQVKELQSKQVNWANPLVERINDYLIKAKVDDNTAKDVIRQYLEIQATDFTKLDAKSLIRMSYKQDGYADTMIEKIMRTQYADLPEDLKEDDPEEYSRRQDELDVKLELAARDARTKLLALQERTAVPEVHQKEVEDNQLAIQARQGFEQKLPQMVQQFEFASGTLPQIAEGFKYNLSTEDRAAIQTAMLSVPGIEHNSPEEVASVMEFLAFKMHGPARDAALAKHIETKFMDQRIAQAHNPTPPIKNGVVYDSGAADLEVLNQFWK